MAPQSKSLAELAKLCNVDYDGEANYKLDNIAKLCDATPHDLCFIRNHKHLSELSTSQAGAVILSEEQAPLWPGNKLISAQPELSFAIAATALFPHKSTISGIHPTAIISPSAKIGNNVSIGSYVVIEENTVIADNVEIGHHCVIGSSCHIGQHTRLAAHITLYQKVNIGEHCILHANSVIGSDGFGFTPDKNGQWHKIPQIGGVIIENHVEIGANTTIDCGSLNETHIESGVKLDNHIQIAHNVRIGAHTAVAACVGVSGSTIIGKHCQIAGGVGISGHLTIGDNVIVTGMSMVTKSIDKPGFYSGAFHAIPAKLWKKQVATFRRITKKQTK